MRVLAEGDVKRPGVLGVVTRQASGFDLLGGHVAQGEVIPGGQSHKWLDDAKPQEGTLQYLF